jgi:uncharacterized RDD family membrane protein YckC
MGANTAPTSAPPPPAPVPGNFVPAPPPYGAPVSYQGLYGGLPLTSKGKRLGAHLLELLLIIVTLIIGWLIWSIVIWKRGQSPAKSILGMRVIKLETQRPARAGEMALRELVGKWILNVVPFYTLVSAIFVLVDERNQALWDKIAGTVVVDDPDNRFGL